MIRFLLLFVGLAGSLQSAQADSWSCRNHDLEISCSEDGCATAEAFTPMDVTISSSEMSVCAYTGCWEGQPAGVLQSGRFLTLVADGLAFSTRTDMTADIAITLDTETAVATVLVAGLYAHPMTCTRRPRSDTAAD